MLSKINNKWLDLDSFTAFYVGVFFSFAFMYLFKSEKPFQIFILLFTILFIYRIFDRHKKIKMLTYYSLSEKNQLTDQTRRGYQLGDIIAIMVNLLLCVSGESDFMNQYGDSLFWIVGVYSAIYFAVASLAIIRNNIGLRILCIFLSTMQGLLCCIYLLIILLTLITSLLGINNISAMPTINDSMIDDFIYLGYILETMPIITISTIFISILLYIILIIGTPAYQQEQLVLCLKIVAIIVAMCGILAFFIANLLTPEIMQHIYNNLKSGNSSEVFKGAPKEFALYYNNFSKGNVSNLFYLLFLPYTFGILTANLITDYVKRKNIENASESFNHISFDKIESIDYFNEYYIKRYFYYGGEKWKYEMSIKQYEMENMLSQIQNKHS